MGLFCDSRAGFCGRISGRWSAGLLLGRVDDGIRGIIDGGRDLGYIGRIPTNSIRYVVYDS